MVEALESHFSTALKDIGLALTEDDSPIPDGFITYGKFALADNPVIATEICNNVARQTGAFYTFTEFKRLSNRPPVKPPAPDKNDSAFQAPLRDIIPNLENMPRLQERIECNGMDAARVFYQILESNHNYKIALRHYEKRQQSYEELLLQILTIREAYTLDERGYLDWVLFSIHPRLAHFAQSFFFTPKTILIKEADRKKHTFITGGTGSGKSETKKHIIWHYLTKDTSTAVVVLDPHDKLANEVARMSPNATNDRLVYIRPDFFPKRYVGLNPFDFAPRDEKSLNIAQKHFVAAIAQILGHELTDAQRSLLTPCLGVMLHREGSTLHDLIRFMDDDRNGDLVKYGCTQIPNEQDRLFMRTQFDKDIYASTKSALAHRLGDIVRDPSVRSFLCRESTFDLEKCIEEGKVIVFGFGRNMADKSVVKTIGQLVNALLFSYSMRRGDGNGKPIHLFADECQYFVSPTIEEILGESRKFQLYATLATQRTNQVGRDVLDAIFGNVGCYLIGRNKSTTARKLSEELEIPADDIRGLNDLTFYQVGLDQPPAKTKIDYIGTKRSMTPNQWREVMENQRETYYRWETDFSPDRNVSGFNEARVHHGSIESPPAPSADPISTLPPIPDVTKRH